MENNEFNSKTKTENISNTEILIKELERVDAHLNTLTIDRDKSDKIRGIAFGLSSYMFITGVSDFTNMNYPQTIISNLVFLTSSLIYIKNKKIGDIKSNEIIGLLFVKRLLESKIMKEQKTIQNKK